MLNFKAIVDRESVTRGTLAQVKTTSEATIKKAARDMYYGARRRFMVNFDNHAVTKEIEIGRNDPGVDVSGPTKGYGNLWGFLGFDVGTNPVADLRQYLVNSMHLNEGNFRNGMWTFRVMAPSDQEVYAETVISRYGKSWVETVEDGTTDLSYFLSRRGAGESEGGIQADWVIEERSLEKRPYVSDLMDNFKDSILQR